MYSSDIDNKRHTVHVCEVHANVHITCQYVFY